MDSQLDSLFEQYAEDRHFSGAALIKGSGGIRFERAYGYAHRGFKVPNAMKTKFDTASVTKLFTAVSVLQLVDRGALSLDDRIVDRVDLTGTCIPGDVTLAHLLTHTSGIADDADEELGESYEALFVHKPNYSIRNCVDFIPQFAYKEPKFKAGTDVSYNNCAYVLLGLAIEQAAGRSYRDYVGHHVFRACGMDDTSFAAKDDGDAAIAEGYEASYDEYGQVRWRKNVYSFPPIGTSDGGAYTTVGDLDLFMRAVAGGKLLSCEMTAAIMKPQTSIAREFGKGTVVNGYGFHFVYDGEGKLVRMYKDGVNAGVAAMLAYTPDSETTSIILGNQTCDIWELHRKAEQLLSVRT
ncbi:beta-lactamase family protein [Paenibacillus albicereus]|uniref:Beta-lactamase family protein n=1 Tax=Paenibacillus albicereus TaxID=2726185 RepID=A0A6H2GS87_9BACL|nr:serine hydrolase domain-containing protein [Paenibacillus albicereus]QJC50272.1 beta-lactamase family protein [Paenibacillus albicereus]